MLEAFCRNAVKAFGSVVDWCDDHRRLTLGVVCVLIGFAIATAVFAEEFDASKIKVKCDETDCMIAKKDLEAVAKKYNDLIDENAAMRKGKCGKYRDA